MSVHAVGGEIWESGLVEQGDDGQVTRRQRRICKREPTGKQELGGFSFGDRGIHLRNTGIFTSKGFNSRYLYMKTLNHPLKH